MGLWVNTLIRRTEGERRDNNENELCTFSAKKISFKKIGNKKSITFPGR